MNAPAVVSGHERPLRAPCQLFEPVHVELVRGDLEQRHGGEHVLQLHPSVLQRGEQLGPVRLPLLHRLLHPAHRALELHQPLAEAVVAAGLGHPLGVWEAAAVALQGGVGGGGLARVLGEQHHPVLGVGPREIFESTLETYLNEH